jgi:hypothetical protein
MEKTSLGESGSLTLDGKDVGVVHWERGRKREKKSESDVAEGQRAGKRKWKY